MPEGLIESFDGRFVYGWSSDDLDIYFDDIRLFKVDINRSSQDGRGQFRIDTQADVRHAETPKIVVKFAMTDINLNTGRDASGFVNQVDLGHHRGFAEYLSKIADSPSPPPEYLYYIGSGEAGRTGFLFVGGGSLVELIYYGMLSSDAGRSIVDLGCGCGRSALAIAPYLKPGDRYIGLDTWGKGIEWAQQNLSTRYPNLTFRAFPQINQGHRGGYQADQVFSIEEPAGSVDAVMAMSLFTHLRLPAATGYLREIFRVLIWNDRSSVD